MCVCVCVCLRVRACKGRRERERKREREREREREKERERESNQKINRHVFSNVHSETQMRSNVSVHRIFSKVDRYLIGLFMDCPQNLFEGRPVPNRSIYGLSTESFRRSTGT